VAFRDNRGLADPRPPRGWMAALAILLALTVAAILFIVYWRAPPGAPLRRARGLPDVVAGAVGGLLAAPLRWTDQGVDAVSDYVLAASENAELKRRLKVAETWRDEAAALRYENARLSALLGVRTDPPLPMVFAHTILDARGPFSNSRLADAGSARGVIEGNPVLSDHGLIGRIVGVAPGVSRIMLLTDVQSRTPVLIVRTNGRAILAGDGGGNPVLTYLRSHDALRDGDRVLTSGDGGVIPRGLPVGTVARGIDGVWRVALDSDAAPLDDVRILLFRDFSQLAPPDALAPRTLPSLATGAPPPPPPAAPEPTVAKSTGAKP
jgi:rod shape-determining protein MreC